MTTPIDTEAKRLSDRFTALGAIPVASDVLLPADTLLDLYGEDIRARAYVTPDPIRGEMVLRPDFTVPVVQRHMETRADPVKYTYAGKVFRKQDSDPTRATEYVQVGFEVFDGHAPAAADAEVFAAIWAALDGAPVRAATGDIGLLIAAVRGLRTSEARKAALLRHLWRPGRFRALLDRFGGLSDTLQSHVDLLAAKDPFADAGAEVGLRRRAEVQARIDALREDAKSAPISAQERAMIDAILSLRDTMPNALTQLRAIATDWPGIAAAVDQMAARMEALAEARIDVATLPFEGSYGRTTLEYYDGFVFGFYAGEGGVPVASGGRYDALTQRLGDGTSAPAVGGVIRPDLLLATRERA